jgi:hypothetical protein
MRGSKLINYGTPKYVQLRLRQAQPHVAPKREQNFCVRLKGTHSFKLEEKYISRWLSLGPLRLVCDFICQGCGKKKSIYRKLKKPRFEIHNLGIEVQKPTRTSQEKDELVADLVNNRCRCYFCNKNIDLDNDNCSSEYGVFWACHDCCPKWGNPDQNILSDNDFDDFYVLLKKK